MKKIEDWIALRTTYILLGILALSTLLRLYHIDYQSLWLDELYSIVPTDPDHSVASIIEYAKNDQPPLFFIYIHYAFRLFGYNELVGRLACVFAGILGILATYFLGKECRTKEVGIYAAFLTGINYFHIYYSQELRFYSLTFLFTVLSYLFFLRSFKRNKIIDYAAYVTFTVALLYTHYYGIIIFCVQALTFPVLLLYKRGIRFVVGSLVSGVAVVVAFIPWIPIVLNDSKITSTWINKPSPFFFAEYFYDYTGKDIGTTLIFLILIYFYFNSLKTSDNKPIDLIIIIWIALSYFLPYIRSIISTSLLHLRYTIVTLPAWIILLAIGWFKFIYRTRTRTYVIAPTLIVFFTINMIFFKQHYTQLEKDQFREASEIVKTHNPLQYPIYSALPWHFNYYFRNSNHKVRNINDDLSTVNNFWLLQAHYPQEAMDAEIARLSEHFAVVKMDKLYHANAIEMRRK